MPKLKCISTVPKDGTLVALVYQRVGKSPLVALMQWDGAALPWSSFDGSQRWPDGVADAWIEPEAFSNGLMPGKLIGTTMRTQ